MFDNLISCLLSLEFDKDTDKYIVYILNEENNWFYLTKCKDLKSAVYFCMHFYMCHSNFTRLSINYLA